MPFVNVRRKKFQKNEKGEGGPLPESCKSKCDDQRKSPEKAQMLRNSGKNMIYKHTMRTIARIQILVLLEIIKNQAPRHDQKYAHIHSRH